MVSVYVPISVVKATFPLLFVSAKDTPLDRVMGITLGSDDYITKPFLPLEFVARVKALFRRSDPHFYDASMTDPVTRFICGNLVLFPVSHRVTIQERDLNVTPTEFDFLLYMIQRADNAVSQKRISRTDLAFFKVLILKQIYRRILLNGFEKNYFRSDLLP